MNFWMTFRIARRALGKNKLRAGLTVLGIVIGVAAVIAMVSVGQSASAMIQGQFANLGTNVVFVLPGSEQSGGARGGLGTVVTLTAADAKAVEKECPSILAASPICPASGQVIYGNSNWSPNEIVGVDEDYLTIRNWPVERGDFFGEREIIASAKVCVVGRTIVESLFQTTDPIGRTIRVKNIPFTVVGVLEEKGANMVGQDQDNIILMPYTTVQKRMSGSAFNNIGAIMASARSYDRMDEATFELRGLLRERHRIRPGDVDDFRVGNSAEIANVLGIITGTMTYLLASIASVSLLVGGVGIMNIMLVSVTERTREIGIRMAVGAKSGDILRQFLLEAILLSLMGGLVGVILGVSVAVGMTTVINSINPGSKWPIVISPVAIVIALGFSAGVGLFFGFFPALRASKLDPIDSLRYE